MTRRKLAVVTADTLSETMAGPAIRAWHIARLLSAEHDVRLVSTVRAELPSTDFSVTVAGDRELRELVDWCDVLVFQGWVLAGRPYLARSDKVLVADVYDPMHLEQLEQAKDAGEDGRRAAVRNTTAVLNEQLLRGDYFLCASDEQRAFWLGQLAALGRVNTAVYDEDPTLRALIDVAPFGIDDAPPRRTGPGARGVVPGIGADDHLVLWGGGIYNWFDPLTLIDAVDRLRVRLPTVRLLFMGLRHPNPEIPMMRMASEARRRSDALGLTGTHVFFNEGWVPYRERQNFLLDADVGVSTHLDHVETAFSYRTRVLDYLWAGVPVVSTDGDAVARMIRDEQLGATVPAGDAAALEHALDALLTDRDAASACRDRIAALSPRLRWSSVLEPLVRFCRAPRRAPDLLDARLAGALGAWPEVPDLGTGWRHDIHLGARYLREGGPVLLGQRIAARVRRLRSGRGHPA